MRSAIGIVLWPVGDGAAAAGVFGVAVRIRGHAVAIHGGASKEPHGRVELVRFARGEGVLRGFERDLQKRAVAGVEIIAPRTGRPDDRIPILSANEDFAVAALERR